MIKNIVLDIGNVMVTFYPDLYISGFVYKKGEIDFLNKICFNSAEWKLGDVGESSRKDIIEAICKKYPSDAEAIHAVMDNCDEMLRASKKNTELLKKLHGAGVGVYFLSNTNPEAFEYMTSHHEFFNYMDGGIASFKEGLVKPSEDIFKLFLERYGKNAEECVFVDDTPVNVDAAASVGFNTVVLKNIDDLSAELCAYPELAKIINDQKGDCYA
jgi:putative hydrolase of the HAD superfamily